jgi:hypothetical protein
MARPLPSQAPGTPSPSSPSAPSARAAARAVGPAPPTDRKALFCHQCEQQKTFNIRYYLQAETEIRMDNTTFASVFLGTHNMKLNATTAGVIPRGRTS